MEYDTYAMAMIVLLCVGLFGVIGAGIGYHFGFSEGYTRGIDLGFIIGKRELDNEY